MFSLFGGTHVPSERIDFIPDVLPVVYQDQRDPDAYALGTGSAAHTQEGTESKEYDPKKSILFNPISWIDADLFAYLVIALAIFFLCIFIIHGAVIDGNYNLYTSRSRFVGPIGLFIGTITSLLLVSYSIYNIKSTGMFALFAIMLTFLVLWFFNLINRIDSSADGLYDPTMSWKSNGTVYLAVIIILTLWMTYIAWKNNTFYGLLLLVSVLWFMYLFYIWLDDDYKK